MGLDRIRAAIKEAVSFSVQEIQLPGIANAAVTNVTLSCEQLRLVAAQTEQEGYSNIRVSVDVELFLRISNTDVLSSIEQTAFRVRIDGNENDLRAVATTDKDWAMAWERGMEPIKQAALQGMCRDALNIIGPLSEDNYTFQVAMVLFASEVVGPYAGRIATFVGYPLCLVQVMAARLYAAEIWEVAEVRCENWFDPQKGGVAFMLDLMVAEGKLVRRWSEERKAYAYHALDIDVASHFAV